MPILAGKCILWGLQLLLSLKVVQPLARLWIARKVERSGLFDSDYYREHNPDVVAAKTSLLAHYVRYGDREGRSPNPLFDPRYYRASAGFKNPQLCTLFHYLVLGYKRPVQLSHWFDNGYYRQHNKDVARSGMNPLVHFIRWGGQEGRSPSAEFDSGFYLRDNPDVAASGVNPLMHYVLCGKSEGRRCHADSDTTILGEATTADLLREQTKPDPDLLVSRLALSDGSPQVDVVIPVYGDRFLTWRCLASVLTSACVTPYRVVVIDDCTPEPEIASDLDELAARGWITLLRNPTNLGFVGSVNRGMSSSDAQDVVLLNADAEVYPGWLDRLKAVVKENHAVASVTPLSNSATICSYPRFCVDNPFPLETDFAQLDQLCAENNGGFVVEAPTANGFCMYIPRDVLNAIGLFDEKTFGKGYGEENDWCQRAIGAGYRNLLTANTFVTHHGSASFKGEKNKRVADALAKIKKRYPNYLVDVDRFIKADPLASAREKLDWARLAQFTKENNMLLVCHSRGGGSERHLQEDATKLVKAGIGVFFLRPEGKSGNRVRIQHNLCRQLPNIPVFDLRHTDELVAALRRLKITSIHSHGLVDFTPDAPTNLQAVAQLLQIPLLVDIHDYKVICPRINLVDKNGRYCGEPSADQCNRCLSKNGNDFGVTDIVSWREQHHRVLQHSAQVIVPDRDVAERLLRYYPDIPFRVEPHEQFEFVPNPRRRRDGERLTIVVIGAIGKIKGYRVLLECARDARRRGLPIDFVVMGYTMNDAVLEKEEVKITGKYQEEQALDLLHSLNPRGVFFPGIWPETYSYTLTLALKAGLPVYAFDIGAIGARLKDISWNEGLMSLSISHHPEKVNDFMIKCSPIFK